MLFRIIGVVASSPSPSPSHLSFPFLALPSLPLTLCAVHSCGPRLYKAASHAPTSSSVARIPQVSLSRILVLVALLIQAILTIVHPFLNVLPLTFVCLVSSPFPWLPIPLVLKEGGTRTIPPQGHVPSREKYANSWETEHGVNDGASLLPSRMTGD